MWRKRSGEVHALTVVQPSHSFVAGHSGQDGWFDHVSSRGVNDIELAERGGDHIDHHHSIGRLGLVELVESRSSIFVQNRGVHSLASLQLVRCDVLVMAEQVRWVVAALEGHEPGVRRRRVGIQ